MNGNFLVKMIYEMRTGTSQRTGNEYRSQDLLLEWNEEIPSTSRPEPRQMTQRMAVTMHGQVIDAFWALNPEAGKTYINADLLFDTRMWGSSITNQVILLHPKPIQPLL